jgi:hypothetical protein
MAATSLPVQLLPGAITYTMKRTDLFEDGFLELLKATDGFRRQMNVDPHQAANEYFSYGWVCMQALDDKQFDAVMHKFISMVENRKSKIIPFPGAKDESSPDNH